MLIFFRNVKKKSTKVTLGFWGVTNHFSVSNKLLSYIIIEN